MNMTKEDKILVGQVLVRVLDDEVKKLEDPYDDNLPAFIYKALTVQMRMKKYYMSEGNPPEMDEQLAQMEGVIKRLMDLQNKKCY